MNRAQWTGAVVAAVAVLTVSYAARALAQQPPGAKRTTLMKQDLSGIPGREGVLGLTELAPGAKEPRHTHSGDLFAYVQEGTITLSMEGKPTATVKQGEAFFVPVGTIHAGENLGQTPVKLVTAFVAEKGKPLTTPVQ